MLRRRWPLALAVTAALLVILGGLARRRIEAWLTPPVVLPLRLGAALEHTTEGTSPDDEHGHSVAGCGDLDGDGVPDFAVDAPNADLGAEDAGYARLYSGRTGEVLHTLSGEGPGWFHGHSVDCIGDVDGDDVDDVVVGLIGDGHAGGPGGGARVFSGRTGRLRFAVAGEREEDHFGARVARAGDVDADGVPDFVVGAPGLYTGNIAGYARVHSGRDGALLHRLVGRGVRGDRFGYAVRGLGDLDGDGHADVGVAALRDDDAGPHTGAVYVFSGKTGAALARFAGEHPGDELGHDLAVVADMNGDARPDLLLGAFARERPSFARVLAWPSGQTLWEVVSPRRGDAYGHTVANAGDVDGDGVVDFAVGAPDADVGAAVRAGRVFVYSGADGAELAAFDGFRSDGHFGYALAPLQDLDADGRDSLVIGSTARGVPGRAWVIEPCPPTETATVTPGCS